MELTKDEFMKGPLITWFSSYLTEQDQAQLTYESLLDGVLLHKVFLQFDSRVQDTDVVPSNGEPELRARNLVKILENLCTFYEEQRRSLIAELPDVEKLCQEPEKHVKDAKLLLSLLLGCALHCSNKTVFIERIGNEMDETTQWAIKESEEMIDKIIIDYELLGSVLLTQNIRKRLRQLIHDAYMQQRDNLTLPYSMTEKEMAYNKNSSERTRKLRKELDEKNFELQDMKEEFERRDKETQELIDKLKKELTIIEKTLRDKEDIENSQNVRIAQLEKEKKRYKEKLSESDCYKNRFEEVKRDYELLTEETKQLEEHWRMSKDKISLLEARLLKLSEQINDLTKENDSLNEKYTELRKENEQLKEITENQAQLVMNESHEKSGFSQSSDDVSMLMESSICEQLSNSVQSEALKLQMENRRLSLLVDEIKETSLHESKVFDLEMENKKLNSQVETLSEKLKSIELKNNDDNGPEGKNTLKKLLATERKRSIEAEDKLKRALRKLEEKKVIKNKLNEMKLSEKDFKSKMEVLESEKENALKEVWKLQQVVQEKSTALEEALNNIRYLENKLDEYESKPKNLSAFISDNNSMDTVKRSPKTNKVKPVFVNDQRGSENEEEVKLKALIKTFESQNKDGTQILNNKLSIDKKNNLFKSKESQDVSKIQYDKLMDNYQLSLSENNKLKTQLSEMKNEVDQLNVTIKTLESNRQKLEEECKNLKLNDATEENQKLREDFGKLFVSRQEVVTKYCKIKSQIEKIASDQLSHQKELEAKNSRIIELEVKLNERNHSYNILANLNAILEKDKKALMDHTTYLVKQVQESHFKNLEDRDHYHEAEIENTHRYNSLRRKKEKLEEKIMEQYKSKDTSDAKKKSSTSFISKVSKKLLSRSRRSLVEEPASSTTLSNDFQFLKGCHSAYRLDNSGARSPRELSVSDIGLSRSASDSNKPRTRKSVGDFFSNFNPSDFSFNMHDSRSRKSVDFSCFDKTDEEDFDDELDSTLHESTNGDPKNNNNNDFQELKNTFCAFNKTQDGESDGASRPGSRASSNWSEHGCV